MDISGNKADTNTDKECVLGDLYLGVAVLYKKLNLNEKSNVSRPKRLIREYWKKKLKSSKSQRQINFVSQFIIFLNLRVKKPSSWFSRGKRVGQSLELDG